MKKVTSTKSETIENINPMSALISKLKMADPEIQHYVTALEAENLKFQKQIGKLQSENLSLKNRIIILEQNTNDHCVHESLPQTCVNKKLEQLNEELKSLTNR